MKSKGTRYNSNRSRKTDVNSRAIRDSFFDIIWKSAKMADVKINDLNQYYKEEFKEKSWSEYEATYIAILYKELTESLDYKMITMENQAESQKKGVNGKKYDIWITKGELSFILEVKRFGVRRTGSLKSVNNKGGIYGDLLKLDDLIKTLIKNNPHTYGIAIGFFEGNDSIILDDIESKLDHKIWEILDEESKLKLLICANGKCKYVGD